LTALTSAQRAALAAAPGQGYEVEFFESATDRLRVARILWDGGYIRLTCPEAFEVHRTIIEWGARYSKDRIPERAVGVDPLTGKVMKWVMQRWERVDFFNRYLFGTLAPRVQLDFIPALACSAHLMLHAVPPPRSLEDYVRAGIAMQRLWLTAAAQGLHLQPEMTPVIFRWYRLAERRLSSLAEIDRNVQSLSANIESLLRSRSRKGLEEGLVFLGRVGRSAVPSSRSIRKDLADLMIAGSGVPAG